MRASASASGLVLFFGRQGLSRKKTFRVGVAGHMESSWLACIICSQPPAGINQSRLLIRQTHANANNGRRDIEAPFGAG
jgi:hypothetical protein